jgi:hypothetical protein
MEVFQHRAVSWVLMLAPAMRCMPLEACLLRQVTADAATDEGRGMWRVVVEFK